MPRAGLLPHLRDIRNDEKLLNANVLHLQETSLTKDQDTDEISINGYKGQFNNVGNGKGIVTYSHQEIICQKQSEEVCQTLQIAKFDVRGISSINVYRSSSHSIVEAAKLLKSLISTQETTLITGDFNVCAIKEKKNSIQEMLRRLGFKQLMMEATHIQGGLIDHCYWLDQSKKWELPKVERYSPYHSDHDALLITLKRT